ncbi:MAG: hypothetical protein PHO02_04480 [Candidatus Nanoarchaeia archaeon]|nr:hypothetical protein [Candidatus Nanoarchaeia archaeon]
MKKTLIILLAIALLVTACAQQKAAETYSAGIPAEAPVVETPEAPAEELPAEEVKEESAEAQEEEPSAETAEEPETDERIFEVKKGDELNYKGTEFTVEELTNYGNYMTIDFNPYRFHLYEVNGPEILNGIEYTIVENNFYKLGSVKLRVRPVPLGASEYLIEKGDSITIAGTKLTLGTVQRKDRGDISAYFSSGGNEYLVMLGKTVNAGDIAVTLKSAFFRQRQYAILKIVPA